MKFALRHILRKFPLNIQNPVHKTFAPFKFIVLVISMVLLTVLFFIGGPGNHSLRSFKAFWNLGHILYYSFLPFLLFSFPATKRLQPGLQILIILGITLLLGVLVELLQYNFARTPDLGDIFRNMIGAGIAICFLLPIRKTVPPICLSTCKVVLIVLVLAQCYPIGIALLDEYHARRDFPVLSDFEDSLQIQRWTGGATISIENIDNKNNRAMRADLTTELYSGVTLKYFPRNWLQYQRFQFRIYNPSEETIKITCRIHDQKHTQGEQKFRDRFNRSYEITQGWNIIAISLKEVQQAPDNRQMDLSQIYGVGIFASRLPHPRKMYIDDVRLL